MGLHGKGIFGHSRANTGNSWKKCPKCGHRYYGLQCERGCNKLTQKELEDLLNKLDKQG